MFTLTLVTPEKKLFTDKPVDEIFVPAFLGELNILPGHAPLMTTLNTGVLRYRPQGSNELQYVAISWGYCQVNPKGVTILAETAEVPEEIDLERVEAAIKGSEQQLALAELQMDQMEKHQRKLLRASVRKEVASLKSH